MRKTLVSAAALALGIAGVFSAPVASANPSTPPVDLPIDHALDVVSSTPAPQAALEVAERVLEGKAAEADPSATIALRDLWMSRDELTGADRKAADAMLARPTDGAANDPFGYTAPAGDLRNVCNPRVCVWYVVSTSDAASQATAQRALAVVDSAWTRINGMGYRSPVSDGGAGGTNQFDVYLADVGGSSLYGYCAGEYRAAGRTASGYCVLDNDFSSAQYPTGTPDGNLRVTAAHEFFHAVQFAYDYAEDPWMMESTATWIEERLENDVNDNRNYLPWSQLYAPQHSLDMFMQGAGMQYGNWIFWEYLTQRHGNALVRRAWERSGSLRQDGGRYSLQALNQILRKKGTFANVYARFASDNLVPRRAYKEGAAYPAPKVKAVRTLTKKRRARSFSTRINHLASASYRVKPQSALKGKRWKLRIKVKGPARNTSPRARVLIHMKSGKLKRKNVRLNRKGDGSLRVPFNSKRVSAVSVTLVNASTRMRCNRRTYLACQGLPRDNGKRFKVAFRAVR